MGGCLSTAGAGAVRPAAGSDVAAPTTPSPTAARRDDGGAAAKLAPAAPTPADVEARRKARDGAKRVAIAANALARGADAAIVPHPKAAPTLALLNAAVAASPLFAPLSSPERATLLASMHPVTVATGGVVIAQGDASGKEFYVLEKGAAVATRVAAAGAEPAVVKEYGPGSSFGELALLYAAPRAATITATAPCKLWVLDAGVYASVRRAAAAAAAARRRALVAGAPLLSVLADATRGVVADALERVEFDDGGVVFDAGAAGDAMYFVDEGRVVLWPSVEAAKTAAAAAASTPPTTTTTTTPTPKPIAIIDAGGHFGERALVTADPRAAAAVADSYTVLFRLPAAAFERLLGPLAIVWTAEALRRAPALAPLSPDQLADLAARATRVRLPAGAAVFRAGDPGDAFYVIDDGAADVVAPDGRILTSLERGAVFGEGALLDRAPRAASVVATAPLSLLAIGAADFEARLGSLATLRTVWRADALRRVALLAPLSAAERGALAAALTPAAAAPGEAVVVAGTPGDTFYLVESGDLTVEDPDGKPIGTVTAGGFFGELALLRGAPRAATVRAVTRCTLLALPRAAFEALLGPARALLAAAADGYGPRGAPRLADLTVVAHLGAGAFGRVALVADRGTGRTYALKTLSKPALVAAGLVAHVARERAVGAECDSPFVVRLVAAYRDAARLHLLSEPALGGELFARLAAGPLPEPHAVFYAACVVLGLAHLHGRDLAWRDLKPENVLIDRDGYAKLADFGFARRLAAGDRASTLCGTPEYMAPEMVAQAGHTKAVDWWGLGVLIYEMLVGVPPFSGDDRLAMFASIAAAKFVVPPSVSPQARDLLRRLLTPAPASRLGSGRGGAADVQAHPWFAGVDWGALAARGVAAPWVPPLAGAADASQFGGGDEPPPDPEDEAARERYVSTGAFADF